MLIVGVAQTMGLWIRKAAECLNLDLMGHRIGSMEDSGAQSSVDNDGPGQGILRGRILVSGPEITVVMLFC